jgi:hypothetical protein
VPFATAPPFFVGFGDLLTVAFVASFVVVGGGIAWEFPLLQESPAFSAAGFSPLPSQDSGTLASVNHLLNF